MAAAAPPLGAGMGPIGGDDGADGLAVIGGDDVPFVAGVVEFGWLVAEPLLDPLPDPPPPLAELAELAETPGAGAAARA